MIDNEKIDATPEMTQAQLFAKIAEAKKVEETSAEGKSVPFDV